MTRSFFDLDAFAAALIAARRQGGQVDPGLVPPATAAEAYAVQHRVATVMGPVAGFKTGRNAGAPQIMAPILASGVQFAPAHYSCSDGGQLGVELEVGFKLDADPPHPDVPEFDAAFRRLLRPIVVIEIVATRLAASLTEDPLAKLADNQLNGGLVLGEVARDWDGGALSEVTARMQAGSDMLVDGPTQVPGGDAFDIALGLARMVGEHCGGLRAGQIILTGSLHPLTYVPAGTEVSGWIDGLGAVSARIG